MLALDVLVKMHREALAGLDDSFISLVVPQGSDEDFNVTCLRR